MFTMWALHPCRRRSRKERLAGEATRALALLIVFCAAQQALAVVMANALSPLGGVLNAVAVIMLVLVLADSGVALAATIVQAPLVAAALCALARVRPHRGGGTAPVPAAERSRAETEAW